MKGSGRVLPEGVDGGAETGQTVETTQPSQDAGGEGKDGEVKGNEADGDEGKDDADQEALRSEAWFACAGKGETEKMKHLLEEKTKKNDNPERALFNFVNQKVRSSVPNAPLALIDR